MRQPASKTGAAVLAITLCLVGGAWASPAAAKQRVKLTTLAPKGSSPHRALQKMGQAWRDISGGTVDVVIYAGGIQGGEAAMVERMGINQSQAALLTGVGLEEIEPAVAGLQTMPMMFRSLEELDHVRTRLRPMLEERMRAKGFVVLFLADAGWVRFFSRTPVVHVDDLRKLKLFTWAGDTDTVRLMNAAGLNPVPLETADILTGLQTGLIDAVPSPPFFALASQIYGPAPHMLELNWAPLVGGLVVTKRAWDKIPAEFRDEFVAAAERAGEEIKVAGRSEAEESIRTMKEKWNLTTHPVSAEIESEWRAAAEQAYPAIRGSLVPEAVFDDVRRLLKEYRSAREASD